MDVLDKLVRAGAQAWQACKCNDSGTVVTAAEEDDIDRTSAPALCELTLEYTWAELQRSTRGCSAANIIARGKHGTVYKGTLEEGLDVAVKVLEAPMAPGFEDEVRLLSRCHHPNLVMLLGYAISEADAEGHRLRALVYELLVGGSAFTKLHSKEVHFRWQERLQTSIEAARGLAHMHKFRPELFHRDIKTANILFARDGTAKIADFGLACSSSGRAGPSSASSTTYGGTIGYIAPEYADTNRATEASEVYSMGMVLLEFLTARLPAEACQDGNFNFLLQDIRPDQEGARERVLDIFDARAQWPRHTGMALAAFALLCVHEDPGRRPRFLEMVAMLQQLVLQSAGDMAADARAGAGEDSEVTPVSNRHAVKPFDTFAPDGPAGPEPIASEAAGVRMMQEAPVDALDGTWVHKKNLHIKEVVKGSLILGQDGTETRITSKTATTLAIELDGSTYHAQLQGEELVWDDGDVWIRQEPSPAASKQPSPASQPSQLSRAVSAAASKQPSPASQPSQLSRAVSAPVSPVSPATDAPAAAAAAGVSALANSGQRTTNAPRGRPLENSQAPDLLPDLVERVPEAESKEIDLREPDPTVSSAAGSRDAEGLLGAERYRRLHHICEAAELAEEAGYGADDDAVGSDGPLLQRWRRPWNLGRAHHASSDPD